MRFSYILDSPDQFKSIGAFSETIASLGRAGYQGIEFPLTHPLGCAPDELHRILDKARMDAVSFLSGWSYFNEGLCLCSPDASIRDRTVARLCEYVDVAHEFGALLVIGQMQGFRKDEPDSTLAVERIVTCLRRVAAQAEAGGVTTVLEPVNHLQVGFNHTVTEVRRVIEAVGSVALKPMIDTLHMNIEEEDLLRPIRQLQGELRHVHLCETNGGTFGTGHLDFQAVLNALASIEYTGFVSVKIYRGHLPPAEDAAHAMGSYLQPYR